MERLLDGVDAVIYILDYTKLKTKEEAELLQKLKVSAGRSPSLHLAHSLLHATHHCPQQQAGMRGCV